MSTHIKRKRVVIVASAFLILVTVLHLLLTNFSPFHRVKSVQVVQACLTPGGVCHEAVLYDGVITGSGVSKVKALLESRPIRLLCLNSQGGQNSAGRALIALIRDKNLQTCLANHYYSKDPNQLISRPTSCMSLCAYVFTSGRDPVIWGNTDLWVHRTGLWVMGLVRVDIPDSWFRMSVGYLYGDMDAQLPAVAQYLYDESLAYPFSTYYRMKAISGETLLAHGYIADLKTTAEAIAL